MNMVKELLVNSEEYNKIEDGQKTQFRFPVELPVSLNEFEYNGVGYMLHGKNFILPYSVGDTLVIKDKDDNEAKQMTGVVKHIRVQELHDTDLNTIRADGITAKIPPVLLSDDVPKGFDDWTDSRQNDWFRTKARANFIAREEYSADLYEKFVDYWNSHITDDKYTFDKNPYNCVVRFGLEEVSECTE